MGTLAIVAPMAFEKLLRAACLCLIPTLGACGSEDEGASSNSGGGSKNFPADTSVEGITAFLDAGHYRGEGWKAETETPRNADPAHGGQVRVWVNDVVQPLPEEPAEYPVQSMAVKELYANGEQVGVAAILKTESGTNASSWLYYCYGPASRCSNSEPAHPKEDPLYSRGFDDSCGACHSAIFTR